MFSLLVNSACMAIEQVDLTTPFVVDPSSSTFLTVDVLTLNRSRSLIYIETIGSNGVRGRFRYEGATATNMMNVLNKANLTNNSLHRRILNQLINDGKLSGTVTGTPE